MARQKPPDPKVEALRQSGCLNPRPNRVTDAFFVADDL